MTFMAPIDQGDTLEDHARVAGELGSPFVAEVLRAGHRQLARAPRTARLIATWLRDASAAALATRFDAALHALARGGSSPRHSALYRRQHDDYDSAIGAVLAAEDAFVAGWMRSTPQTNEVGRAAALMTARDRFGFPLELLEIGSSCGLNLNLARYAYRLGGVGAGARLVGPDRAGVAGSAPHGCPARRRCRKGGRPRSARSASLPHANGCLRMSGRTSLRGRGAMRRRWRWRGGIRRWWSGATLCPGSTGRWRYRKPRDGAARWCIPWCCST